MKLRIIVAVAAIALAAVPVARSSAAFTSCGTVTGGGATWSVVAAGVSCGTAKPLVKSLAPKPHPGLATKLGTHRGLKCIEYAKKKTREIACVSRDGRKTVYGVTPPKK